MFLPSLSWQSGHFEYKLHRERYALSYLDDGPLVIPCHSSEDQRITWRRRVGTRQHLPHVFRVWSGQPGGRRLWIVDSLACEGGERRPAENGIFEPFIYKNEHFAKTGSGQT